MLLNLIITLTLIIKGNISEFFLTLEFLYVHIIVIIELQQIYIKLVYGGEFYSTHSNLIWCFGDGDGDGDCGCVGGFGKLRDKVLQQLINN